MGALSDRPTVGWAVGLGDQHGSSFYFIKGARPGGGGGGGGGGSEVDFNFFIVSNRG